MKINLKRRIISSMLVALLFGSRAQAQTGDWQAVQNLRPGTRIFVKAQHHILCVFEAATDSELVCKPLRFLRLGPADSRFDRQGVREIRRAPNHAEAGWIGAGIGAGVGAAVGASTGTTPRSGSVIVLTLGGAMIGCVVGTIVLIFQRGKLIYRR